MTSSEGSMGPCWTCLESWEAREAGPANAAWLGDQEMRTLGSALRDEQYPRTRGESWGADCLGDSKLERYKFSGVFLFFSFGSSYFQVKEVDIYLLPTSYHRLLAAPQNKQRY